MADSEARYTLKIENTRPADAPMHWVAEYISEFAKMLGHKSDVHLAGVRDNCIALDASINARSAAKVAECVRSYRSLNRTAYDRFDRLLRKHGTYAVLYDELGIARLELPGIKKPEEQTVSIRQHTSIKGELTWIGGESELSTAHLSLGNGRTQKCHLSRKMAREISGHLYETFIFDGESNWHRNEEGQWSMGDYLTVKSYELVEDGSLSESLDKMRQVMGDWSQTDDVEDIVTRIRKGF